MLNKEFRQNGIVYKQEEIGMEQVKGLMKEELAVGSEEIEYLNEGSEAQDNNERYEYYYNEILERAHYFYDKLRDDDLKELTLEWNEEIGIGLGEIMESGCEYKDFSEDYKNVISESTNPDIFLEKGTRAMIERFSFDLSYLDDMLSNDGEIFIRDLLIAYVETYIQDARWHY